MVSISLACKRGAAAYAVDGTKRCAPISKKVLATAKPKTKSLRKEHEGNVPGTRVAKVLFEIELGALGQNRVYGKSQLVFGAPNGQIMLCFELSRRHVVEQHSFQRALPNLPFIYVGQNGVGRGTTPLAPAHRQRGAPRVRLCGGCGCGGGAAHSNLEGHEKIYYPVAH